MEQKPLPSGEPSRSGSRPEVRRVKRRKGRRALANFENLPVSTHVYELSAEERACPCCGVERQEIGSEESWQIEYLPGHFERLHHVRKKYACARCEAAGENPQMRSGSESRRQRSRRAWRGRDCWLTSSPASSPITCRFIGWRTFSSGKGSRFREPRSRCGAGTWPIWSSRCTSGWRSGCGSRTWWPPTTRSCPC